MGVDAVTALDDLRRIRDEIDAVGVAAACNRREALAWSIATGLLTAMDRTLEVAEKDERAERRDVAALRDAHTT